MTTRIAINGFGRIGRNVLRVLEKYAPELELVAVNDLTNIEDIAMLVKYDTILGPYGKSVEVDGDHLVLDGKSIKVFAEKDPASLPWGELGVEIVLECTGHFNKGADAQKHIDGGAKKVILSAPGKDVDGTFVMGVNDDTYDSHTQNIISNASCTTNCLAPLAKVFNDAFGIDRGFMMTAHAYTADQNLQDGPHKDLRRARAAAINITPASTGAAKAIGLVLPELNGKLSGSSYRVPVPTGSIVDLTLITDRENLTVEEVNEAYKKAAADGRLAGYLQYNEDQIVSSDIVHNPHSSIFDATLTNVSGNLIKVSSWYDNEWGYSNRLVDLTEYVAERL